MTQPYSDDDRVAALLRLQANDGNISQTAAQLSLSRTTLIKWRDQVMPLAEQVSTDVVDTLELPDPNLDIATRVVRESAFIAFGHLRDIASWDASGNLTFIPSADLAEGASAGLQSIEFETKDDLVGEGENATVIRTTKIKVKRESKLGALTLLAKIAGLIQTSQTLNIDASQNLALPPGMTAEDVLALARRPISAH